MFSSIIDSATGVATYQEALFCTLAALVFGLVIALAYMSERKYTKNFVITLVMLPALVQIVIFAVNGNLGAGIAVLGTFSLVRFRSVPGTSKEITNVFFAMAIGIACGMGQLVFAGLMTVILVVVMLVLNKSSFGEKKTTYKTLKITIPENLDYYDVFDDIFKKYTGQVSLDRVKTVNLGSMYELQYRILLLEEKKEKEMIDEIRCRNGNLPIVCAREAQDELAL